ncbi:hypothetical protein Moror_16085 [Moniliophthora roreri MCA 2997]|uniref:Uncharacterized protein n=1 Tax=Moniliophthora roreri (strain MCA 2997) TaxID=1381753 RepID=V2XAH9_MONRO|nr:hypothetical protein Moror_16085 [Moniliophthora roreri MCA 2997]
MAGGKASHPETPTTHSGQRNTIKTIFIGSESQDHINVPFGVTYEKIGTIQRRLAWPLHKDDTLFRSGRPTGLNIYFAFNIFHSTQAIDP